MSEKPYWIEVAGKRRRFATEEDARRVASDYYSRTGFIVGIHNERPNPGQREA